VERALAAQPSGWRERVDRFLSDMSWDRTWFEMSTLIDGVTAASTLSTASVAVPGTQAAARSQTASSLINS
jgi:hypothetical protein